MQNTAETKKEKEHLFQVYEVVEQNVAKYEKEVSKMSSEIDSLLAHFHDDNAELYTILNNSITQNDFTKKALFRNRQALKKAYFGRIDYRENGSNRDETIYIGKGSIFRDTTKLIVTDWRAPISAAYYESSIGPCSFTAPDQSRIKLDVSRKRTYEVDGKQLIDYYDSETIATDELLTKYLAKNKQAVLGEIIATIQKEQNDIIRKSPFWNVLVQGVAGSGKTTVAMHRISYILYNYQDRFQPKDFYIIGSNRILLNYITGVLPELDVHGAKQMTMEELFTRLMYEDWDDRKYSIVPVCQTDFVKGTSDWFKKLEIFCDEYEWNSVKREDIILNKKQFVQGFYQGTAGVHDITEGKPQRPEDYVELMNRKEIEDYVKKDRTISMMSKTEMLNQRLDNRLDVELMGKNITYTVEERKAIRKAFYRYFGKKNAKIDIFTLYKEFLSSQSTSDCRLRIPCSTFDIYDLAALAYIYKRINETDPVNEAHHIVIDEAQDFGMMVYMALKYCVTGCTYTVMGDISQNIRFGYGLSDWEELKKLLLTGDRDSFGILKKSYRNTVEISKFATAILRHGRSRAYTAEPVIRHGREVVLQQYQETERMYDEAAACIREWQKKDLNTIAVICRDDKMAQTVNGVLGKRIEVLENDLETAEFGAGVLVLPVEYTKGLEFDAVLILDPAREDYPVDDGHAKLLYVAATRALHELCVMYCRDLTGLIADPLPEGAPEELEGDLPDSGMENRMRDSYVDHALISDTERQRGDTILLEKTLKRAERESKNPLQKGTRKDTQKEADSVPKKELLRRELVTARESELRILQQNTGNQVFGKKPSIEELKRPGHANADMAVRWVEKRNDGLYLVSRYGILRLSPIQENVLRVTFTCDKTLEKSKAGPEQKLIGTVPWAYCERNGKIELKSKGINLSVDQKTGCITYLDAENKPFLSEKSTESRLLQVASQGNRYWQYFRWQKNETVYGMDEDGECRFRLRDNAGYLSDGKKEHFPWIYSSLGYAVVMISKHMTIACDITVYGSYLYTEQEPFLDYVIITGKTRDEILMRRANAGLCTKK